MNTAIIVQARTQSTRLPQKIFKEVLGKPLITYLLERLRRTKGINDIIIATTINTEDKIITDYCKKNGVKSFAGSELDVLSRYYEAATEFHSDTIIRITSDCPLMDPSVIETLLEQWNKGGYDYISNTINRTYPRGMDVEIFSYQALKIAFLHANDPYEREHVTPYINRRPENFKIKQVTTSPDMSQYRLTVDVVEDFELIKKILEAIYPLNKTFSLDDIIQLLKKNKTWQNINAHVEQKKN